MSIISFITFESFNLSSSIIIQACPETIFYALKILERFRFNTVSDFTRFIDNYSVEMKPSDAPKRVKATPSTETSSWNLSDLSHSFVLVVTSHSSDDDVDEIIFRKFFDSFKLIHEFTDVVRTQRIPTKNKYPQRILDVRAVSIILDRKIDPIKKNVQALKTTVRDQVQTIRSLQEQLKSLVWAFLT